MKINQKVEKNQTLGKRTVLDLTKNYYVHMIKGVVLTSTFEKTI